MKRTIEKEENRINRTAQEIAEVESKQEAVRDEIARLNENAEVMDRQLNDLDRELTLAEKRAKDVSAAEDISVPKIK